MRSPEEEQALIQVQQALGPEVLPFVDKLIADLAGTDPEDLDAEINNIGHLIYRMMRSQSPHLSEAICLGLPFAFVELVRERMREQRST